MSENNGIPTIDLGDFMSDDSERRKSFVQTFGQGLLECIQTLCHDLGLVRDLPAVSEHD